MKKTISIFLALLLTFCIFSTTAFANDYSNDAATANNPIIIDEVYGIYDANTDSDVMLTATNLITNQTLKLSKTSNTLIITAKTFCTSDVKKCGFTYIKLQRLINGSWTDYSLYCYYDQYAEGTSKTFSKTISAPKGYSYRVICEHYAEKTKALIFKDKETKYNVTSSLSF